MFTTPRLTGGRAATAAGVAAAALVASFVVLSPDPTAWQMPRGLDTGDIAVPIAHDIKDPHRQEDSSVPSASSVRLEHPVGDPAPTF